MTSAATGTVTLAKNMVFREKCRRRKNRVGTANSRLSMSRCESQQQRGRMILEKEADVWNSSLSTFMNISTTLMQNARAGEKLPCLLNVINEQVQGQKYLWSSQLQFPTKDGYKPLRQIRARRLRSLLALAYYLDEKNRRSRTHAASPSTVSSSDKKLVQEELEQMSLEE